MKWATAFGLFLGCTAVPLQAETGHCDQLIQFATEAVEPGGATCTTSKVLGKGTSIDCYWSFDFRSDAARAKFRDHAKRLQNCADGVVTVEGAIVNHPDSFDQLTAVVAGHPVSLSLKDKGALGQTLVFLRRSEKLR